MADAAEPSGTQVRPSLAEIEKTLVSHIVAGLGREGWERIRREHDVPAFRNQLRQHRQYLLEEFGLSPHRTQSTIGAYFDFLPFVFNIFYDCFNASVLVRPRPGEVGAFRIKISLDGRALRSNKNIGIFVTVVERLNAMHTPWEQHTVALFHLAERCITGHPIWSEISLNMAISILNSNYMAMNGMVFTVDTYLCGDWKLLKYIIGHKAANLTGAVEICGWCTVHQEYFSDLSQVTDLFRYFALYARRLPDLPALTSLQCRYCPMHGVNRLVDTVLHNLMTHENMEAIQPIVQQVCPKWGDDDTLQVIQMKRFMERQLFTQVASLFAGHTKEVSVRRPHQEETWPLHAVITRLISACTTYYQVIWMNPPSEQDWSRLLEARVDILSAFCALRWPLTPTIHYMTDHLFVLHAEEKNFFPWLQEGAEHHHQNDRISAKHLFHGGDSIQGRAGMMVQVLQEQELRRILRARGHDL